MPHRSRIGIIVAAVVLLGWSGVSEAFWPFTRAPKVVPDSLQNKQWDNRFEAWQEGIADTAATTLAPAALPGTASPKLSAAELARLAHAAVDSVTTADSTATGQTDSPDEDEDQDQDQDELDPEIKAKIAAAQLAAGFRPNFSATLTSDNDRMRLNSSLNVAFSDPSGVSLTSGLTYGDEYNLNQGTNTRTKGIINTFTLPLRAQGMKLSLTTSNSRRNVLGARTTTNERTTTATDNRNAGLTASIGRQLIRGLAANASYRVDFRYGNQDIVATGTSSGDRENRTRGQAYGVGLSFNRIKWLQLNGRLGRATDNNTDITSSFITDDNPLGEQESSSNSDSMRATVNMPLGAILPQLTAEFEITRSNRSFTDPARTSSGATGGGGNFILENEVRFRRTLRLRSKFVPVSRLTLDLSFEVSRDSVGYQVRQNAFNDTQRRRSSIRGKFDYHSGGSIGVNYEYARTTVNRDEPGVSLSPQTRIDRNNRLTANISQEWTKTMKTRLYGEIRLAQGFYAHEGPQGFGDRDDLRTQLGLDIEGTINPKMNAKLTSYIRTYNQAFIDDRRSGASRNETEFVLRLDFRYQITQAFSLHQLYGLSSKVLEALYNPTPNTDTLNRNHFLQTNWDYKFNPRVSFSGMFNYILQDNGAFQSDPTIQSTKRLFAPTVENRKNEARVQVQYAVLPDGKLSISSSQQVTRDRRTTFTGTPGVRTTLRSNFAVSVNSVIVLGDFELNSRATRNQNINSSFNRAVFFNVDTTLKYTF